ncbi:calcium-binding protein [Sulfitobacter sp. HNIBRBA3233]|uniref:calcium-binding protein n=1 Tax=Sulfitobacter marinivivus TaxID=3158558 RepID=UPI0032DEC248
MATGITETIGDDGNLVGTAGDDRLTGGDWAYIQGLDGNDTLTGGLRADLVGQNGDDVITGAGWANVQAGNGNDTVTVGERAFVLGGAGDDLLSGGENATLRGGTGQDTLSGETGTHLLGDWGDDLFLRTAGSHAINGGPGSDTYRSDVPWSDLAEIAPVVPAGGMAHDARIDVTYADGSTDRIADVETFEFGGSDGLLDINDLIFQNFVDGTDGPDTLVADDTLIEELQGFGGDDLFRLGLGADVVLGGAGTDNVTFDGSDAYRIEARADGSIRVFRTPEFASHVVAVTDSIEKITGTSRGDGFAASAQTQVLRGLGGADSFDLRQGDGVHVEGGAGRDAIRYDTTRLFSIDADTDVSLLRGRGWSGDAAGDTYAGVEDVFTGSGNDLLTGDHGANMLWGRHGDDTLMGNGGDDTLVGGNGRDVALYAFAFDRYEITVKGAFGNLIEVRHLDGLEGTDTLLNVDVLHFADRTLPAHDGGVPRTEGTDGDDVLRGTPDVEGIFLGLAGDDVILPGRGGGESFGDRGTDTLSFYDVDLAAGRGIRVDLTAPGSGQVVLSDISYFARHDFAGIEVVTGTSAADFFNAAARATEMSMRGLGGADVFVLSQGAETVDGGAGRDRIVFRSELDGTGVNMSLLRGRGWEGDAAGDHYTGIEDVVGTAYNDTITGDHGDNLLRGGVGDDILIGNDGDDYLDGGGGTDRVVFAYDQSAYEITREGFRTQVDYIGADGVDGRNTLAHIEVLQFADGDLVL